MSSTSLPFDFFAGLARRFGGARAPVRQPGVPVTLSYLETAMYLGLVSTLLVAVIGVGVHHRSFVTGRVASEEAERQNTPELLGQLICEQDRVIGVSIQRVFDIALVVKPGAPRPLPAEHRILDGTLAAAHRVPALQAPVNLPVDEDADESPVVLQRPATWRPRSR